jgi:hypothetical protein
LGFRDIERKTPENRGFREIGEAPITKMQRKIKWQGEPLISNLN